VPRCISAVLFALIVVVHDGLEARTLQSAEAPLVERWVRRAVMAEPDDLNHRVAIRESRVCDLRGISGARYFGFRYYDPNTGQWLSREPLGESESLNLYAYCHNDPINKVDVLGLAEIPVNQADASLVSLALAHGLLNGDSTGESIIDTAVLNSILIGKGLSPIDARFGRADVPCNVCHGRSAGGHIDGVSRLYSNVGGQVYSSSSNRDMTRKIGAGAWGTTRALPADFGNFCAATGNFFGYAINEAFGTNLNSVHPAYFNAPYDAHGPRIAGQQQVYPGISSDDLLVQSGAAMPDVALLFAAPEAIALKPLQWGARLPRFAKGGDTLADLCRVPGNIDDVLEEAASLQKLWPSQMRMLEESGVALNMAGRRAIVPGETLIGFMRKDGTLIGEMAKLTSRFGHSEMAAARNLTAAAKRGEIIPFTVGKTSAGKLHAYGSGTFPPPGGIMSDSVRALILRLVE